MLSAGIAVLAAICNATASVLQRRAAREVPDTESFHSVMIAHLTRRPVWWAGILAVIGGAVGQATALSTGRIATVQPILTTELPFTLVLGAVVFRRGFGRRAVLGAGGLTAGVALLLISITPSAGRAVAPGTAWLIAGAATAVLLAGLIGAGLMARGGPRAALLGSGTATGFAFTAALMKQAMARLDEGGITGLLTTWQTYAACAVGLGTLYLLQNALQAGTLAASQPAITVGDALLSIVYGTALFHEQLRLGLWAVPGVVGLALIAAGAVELSRSPLVTGRGDTVEHRAQG